MGKLILLMIDGVSADYVAAEAGRLPHLSALMKRGMSVRRLHSEVLGTSLPGRTSILTGQTADVSGVYGNKIWDAGAFRYASPDDVRTPTIPAMAREAGMTVANIGMGMIRLEDTDLTVPPWWVGSFVQRARDPEPEPSSLSWTRVALAQPDPRFVAACEAAGVPHTLPQMPVDTDSARTMYGILADNRILDWVGVLAASDYAPDLITAEWLMTDNIQHYSGYASPMSHWIIEAADQAVGRIIERLRAAGVLDQWNIAVLSDHGHSTVTTSLRPQVLFPEVTVQCEGGSLIVAPKDHAELVRVTAALAAYGVEPYPADCIPPELAGQLAIFVAPEGMSFEGDDINATEAVGPARVTSTHGLRPGLPGDDRFAVFAGPDVVPGVVDEGDAVQVAPTLAAILGLSLEPFPAVSLFDSVRAG